MEIKGIIHGHSAYSYDARLSMLELKELALRYGWDFVCMTEHTDEMTPESAQSFVHDCAQYSDESFLFIPGFEVPYAVAGSREHAHILMIGIRHFYNAYAPDINALKAWTQHAPFVVLAHPVRNQFIVDPALLDEIDAIEVWNQQYEGKKVPRTRSLALYTMLRSEKPTLVATGGVDLHRIEHAGPPYIRMHVSEFTENCIIEKLQCGDFVVSSPNANFSGLPQNIKKLMHAYRLQSACSIMIIFLGKWVNATLARLGLTMPRRFKEIVRRYI